MSGGATLRVVGPRSLALRALGLVVGLVLGLVAFPGEGRAQEARRTGAEAIGPASQAVGSAGQAAGTARQSAVPLDLLIRGGRVLDGTGNPWFHADVGVREGRIAAVGDLSGAEAGRTIDATGLYVTPGFIDLHSHADGDGSWDGTYRGGLTDEDARRRAAPNLVAQGVTTVVVGQDGRSAWPIADQGRRMEARGIGPNAVLLAGHNTIRFRALGEDHRRPSTQAEVEEMARLVRQAMEEGAAGLSAGLEYVPGRWSTTDEVARLVEEVAAYGGVYIVHERSSGATPMWFWPSRDEPGPPTMLETVLEDIEIAERTGVPTVATHIKARGTDYWGTSRAMIGFVERARARGVPIWADQYPYNTTGSDGSTVLLPDWFVDRAREASREREAVAERWEGEAAGEESGARAEDTGAAGARTVVEAADAAAEGPDAAAEGPDAAAEGPAEEAGREGRPRVDFAAALRAELEDPESARELRRDIAHEIGRRGGPENLVIMDHPDAEAVGKSLAEVAAMRGADPVETALFLQSEGYADRPGGVRVRGFSLSEIDVQAFAARPWVATASDAGVALPGDGPVHARYYGTFPRKIRRYALERGLLSVEDAVRSATSLPATILGLEDRGLVRKGMRADLAVLDLDRLEDRATFFEPHRYPEGVAWVFVGGAPVVADGELTWELPGRVLVPRRPGEGEGGAGTGGT